VHRGRPIGFCHWVWQWWEARAVWNVHLPVSLALSGFRGVDSWTKDNGRCGLSDEYAISGGITRSLIRFYRCTSILCPCWRWWIEARLWGWKSRDRSIVGLVAIVACMVFAYWRLCLGAALFLFLSVFYHKVRGCLVELLSQEAFEFSFPDQICSIRFCHLFIKGCANQLGSVPPIFLKYVTKITNINFIRNSWNKIRHIKE
jgi:hypothetical protein